MYNFSTKYKHAEPVSDRISFIIEQNHDYVLIMFTAFPVEHRQRWFHPSVAISYYAWRGLFYVTYRADGQTISETKTYEPEDFNYPQVAAWAVQKLTEQLNAFHLPYKESVILADITGKEVLSQKLVNGLLDGLDLNSEEYAHEHSMIWALDSLLDRGYIEQPEDLSACHILYLQLLRLFQNWIKEEEEGESNER